MVCDCDNTALKNALDIYTSVISLTEYPYPVYLLHTNELQKNKISIFPNPFSTNFNIKSDDIVSNYTLIDISGKQLIATSSKNELDNLALQLNSGVYFLNLNFEKGQTVNFKLIKE